MVLVLIVAIGLAAARVSRFIGKDSLLDEWRYRFFRRFPYGEPFTRMDRTAPPPGRKGKGPWTIADKVLRKPSKLGRWVECPWCSSVWFAAAITVAVTRYMSVPVPWLVWAASCSVAGLCAKLDAA